MADSADVARAVFAGIHNLSAGVLKGQAAVFDKALPGASTIVGAATDALGGVWKSAGLLPEEPAPVPKAPAAGSDASPKSSTGEPEKAAGSALPGGGGLLADARVADVVKKGTDKVAWFLAKRGILTTPPPPPEEALRTPPPVVDGKRVDSTGAQKASGADGTRLSKRDGL